MKWPNGLARLSIVMMVLNSLGTIYVSINKSRSAIISAVVLVIVSNYRPWSALIAGILGWATFVIASFVLYYWREPTGDPVEDMEEKSR